ncbi:Gfo/Idh/MocA family protein [Rhodococcus koreensis]
MTPASLRIGMVGAAEIARLRHIPGLRDIEGVELAAVVNNTPDSSRRAATEFGFKRCHKDWTTLVSDEDIDAVFVCTPPVLHAEITIAALQAGKHVFCQGRMARNLGEARAMLAADEASSNTTMLCPPPHYMAVEQVVQRMIDEGAIGEVRHVVVSHTNDLYLDPAAPRHWRQVRALQGENILDVGVTAEVLHRLFGPVRELSARSATWVPHRQSGTETAAVELPDSVSILGRFETGALLTATFSGAVRGGAEHMVLHGSRGTLRFFAHRVEMSLDTGEGERPVSLDQRELRTWGVEREFVTAIRQGRKGNPSFHEGARYMAFSQAVAEAIATGDAVAVPSTPWPSP